MQHPELEYYRRQMDVTKQEINVEKSRFFPEISVGYFNQQIDLVPNFQGWNVTVSIPLWFVSQQKQVKIARLNYQILQNEYEYHKQRLFKEYHTLYDEYLKLKQKLEYYETEGLQLANKIVENSSQLYKLGQIDYVEYLQNLEEAFNIEQEYLSTLNNYNAVVITLNYYTYQ
jgi:cobalt-zinc-cadmium resistance protein CzcA